MRCKKILHIINGMGSGGAEKDIMNWYRNIDREYIQFDFLIRANQDFYKEEIESLGGHLYRTQPFPRKLFSNMLETRRFLRKHQDYDVIHVHGNALIYIYPLIVAKKIGVGIRCMHIHNSKASSRFALGIHKLHKFVIAKYANRLIACSKRAGEFAYGKRNFGIINNAMELERYDVHGDNIKKDLGISKDTFIVTHIGRFLPVKNQEKVIEIFKEIVVKKDNAVLLLIGTGPLKKHCMEFAKLLKVEKKVMFLGERKDVERILAITDVMAFPSLYEGIPLVVLEAQASRTKILYSDTIDNEVSLTPYARNYPLSKSSKEWAHALLAFAEEEIECNVEKRFEEAGYTVNFVVEQLYRLYEGKSIYE